MENNSKIIDVILLAIIVIILVYAVTYFETDQVTTIDRYATYYNETNTPTFDVNYEFTSSSFSVNSPISIYITAHPSIEYMSKHPDGFKNVNMIWIYFPDGVTNSMQLALGRIVSHPILLTRGHVDETKIGTYYDTFRGNAIMNFVQEGDKCPTVTNQMYIEVPKECQSGDIPLIHISSFDSTMQYNQGKINTGLALAVLGFAIASVRGMIQNLFRHK